MQVLLNSAKTVAETVVPDADVANIPCDRREVETWEGQELPAFEWIMHIVKGTSSISSAVAAAADSEAGSLILGGASTGTPTIGGGTAKIVMPPIDEELKEELTSLVLALLRLDKLGPALQSYKDGLMRLIKNFSKKVNERTRRGKGR